MRTHAYLLYLLHLLHLLHLLGLLYLRVRLELLVGGAAAPW